MFVDCCAMFFSVAFPFSHFNGINSQFPHKVNKLTIALSHSWFTTYAFRLAHLFTRTLLNANCLTVQQSHSIYINFHSHATLSLPITWSQGYETLLRYFVDCSRLYCPFRAQRALFSSTSNTKVSSKHTSNVDNFWAPHHTWRCSAQSSQG